MSACNGPPVVRTLSGMVAMAGEAEKEVEDGKPKKVKDDFDGDQMDIWIYVLMLPSFGCFMVK